jgi:serine O-acetyltransferase
MYSLKHYPILLLSSISYLLAVASLGFLVTAAAGAFLVGKSHHVVTPFGWNNLLVLHHQEERSLLSVRSRIGHKFVISPQRRGQTRQWLDDSDKCGFRITQSSTTSSSSTLLHAAASSSNDSNDNEHQSSGDDFVTDHSTLPKRTKYVLGKNLTGETLQVTNMGLYWNTAVPINKSSTVINMVQQPTPIDNTTTLPNDLNSTVVASERVFNLTGRYDLGLGKNSPIEYIVETKENDEKLLKVKTTQDKRLSKAFWFYGGGGGGGGGGDDDDTANHSNSSVLDHGLDIVPTETDSVNLRYEDIDQSIPESVYDPSGNIDLVWSLLRQEARIEAAREPLLVSFLYSTILNHATLESALAFHLANRLASPSMDSIQIMNIILDASKHSPYFGRDMRADLIAVRDRDPACTCLPDVFLHFKGFHALQSYRVAHYLWNTGKKTLAHYIQSQMSQNFQIDIHPKATLKSGIMLDHGTGVVIGETAVVGYNCSILHHVTLGGSGKRGVDRHPKVGNGVLLGAGATVLGNIQIGDGCQIGAGTLVIDDLPAHSVAVGVPSKIIGSYKSQEQPSHNMDQVGSEESVKYLQVESFSMDGI